LKMQAEKLREQVGNILWKTFISFQGLQVRAKQRY
jgi:hypothetical protein